jgi:DNA-binding NarL/FixJ family response regulator
VIRVAVVASVLAVRAGLQALLSEAVTSPEAADTPQVVFQAASLEDFAAFSPQADVLLVTGEAASPSALRRLLLQMEGHLSLLILSDDPQAAQGLANLPLRAWGVLTLGSSAEELLAAVRALHEGLLVGAPALLQSTFSRFLISEASNSDALVEALTERESQVLQLLARGLANKQIAAALGISEHTVKFHVSSIYAKLGVTNRTEAVRTGMQRGLVVL